MTGSPRFVSTLAELADIAEIRGASATAAELRRAAATLRADAAGTSVLDEGAHLRRLADDPGLSPGVAAQLSDVARDARGDIVRRALDDIPFLLRRLIQRAILTTAEAARLVRDGGVATIGDLQAALDGGRLDTAVGAAAARLRGALEPLEREAQPLPLGRAWDLLDAVIRQIAAGCPMIEDLAAAGPARRMEPIVSSLVLVGQARDPASVVEILRSIPGFDEVRHWTPRRVLLSVRDVEVDVRLATAEDFGTTLFRATGPPAHVGGVERRRPTPKLAGTEEGVYAHAGLPFIPPELRQANGEIEAAAAHALPRLLSPGDMRGDLHMHTTYSDGRDTIDAMVAACSTLGYEYIAITDHSERAGASRTVTLDQLARQRDEIARLRESFPGLAILHGVEVDVMPNGELDFPDSVLETLDIVLASVHDAARQDARRLTARSLAAIRHPLVTILSHPGNRIVGGRAAYPLDYPALYEAAGAAGTALEIDGAPVHLDLDGEAARAAVAAGVTLVVNSDAHRADWLARQMRFGVGTARRGWVEPRHVLNTRPLAEVRRFIRAKRDHGGPARAC